MSILNYCVHNIYLKNQISEKGSDIRPLTICQIELKPAANVSGRYLIRQKLSQYLR